MWVVDSSVDNLHITLWVSQAVNKWGFKNDLSIPLSTEIY